jgi:DNA-binding response OmpR family regulator
MQVMAAEHFGMLTQFLPLLNRDASCLPDDLSDPESYRVLIVEENVALAKLLATGLSAETIAVDIAHDGASAAGRLGLRSYDLVIVDLDTAEPEVRGLLGSLKTGRNDLHVLALGVRNGMESLVTALEQGADDYLFKPFSLVELMARVRALRRRSEAATPLPAKSSKLTLHPSLCRAERDGRMIELTPREFALLDYLVQNAGKTVSRALLTQEVWNMPAEANTNIVDVYIKYLRDKIDGDHEEKLIRTVRGMGYFIQLQK